MATTYRVWMEQHCGVSPHSWQVDLGSCPTCTNRLVRVPTGMGKTLGVLAAWAYNRLYLNDPAWPRRLIWCLPMRVLVEQTQDSAQNLLIRLDVAQDVDVHLLMGGCDAGDWAVHPEKAAVLVGTQDMLLSRALNRGYGAARARWPMDFGLLNQDALWVMDEIQLMDVGLATSAQLQAFRQEDADKGKELRPCRTWWMSATLQPSWLESVDTKPLLATMDAPLQIPAAQRQGGLWNVRKPCRVDTVADDKAFAAQVLLEHKPGTLTLVIVNTVNAAMAVHEHITASPRAKDIDLRLVHSRYRPAERASWRKSFLCREAPVPPAGRIVVATQVVEAGVDVSAHALLTELAPWPNLVQRFGRCARYEGDTGQVTVLDRGWTEKDSRKALPYELSELDAARDALAHLSDVSPASLETYEDGLSQAQRQSLYVFSPRHLLLRREWEELFDTTPDLSGADIDVSRFIRSGEELDCIVFWREIPVGGPSNDWQPSREECCAVSFLRARDWLCGVKTKSGEPQAIKRRKPSGLKYPRAVAWVWDWVDGVWKRDTRRGDLLPGRVVLVDASFGGYDPRTGWNSESVISVPPVIPALPAVQDLADAAQERDNLSEAAWKTIATHGYEVGKTAQQIAIAAQLPSALADLMELAGLWHDVGKAHPCFQGSMRHGQRPERSDLAKAPQEAWSHDNLYRAADGSADYRPGLRHELASALALISTLLETQHGHEAFTPRPSTLLGEAASGTAASIRTAVGWETRLTALSPSAFNLLIYLVAAHHGKVRLRLHAAPQDEEYAEYDGRGLPVRGIRDGDVLAPVRGLGGDQMVSAVTLSLEPAKLGLSELTGPSWTERTLALLHEHGPGSLAFMEAILRAADIRASRLATADTLLDDKGGGAQ